MTEPLSEFIQRILRQKGLSLHDVERNSEKAITSGAFSGDREASFVGFYESSARSLVI